jgi:hypothetical protein
MRYWGYFAAKLALGGSILYGLLFLLSWAFPPEPCFYDYCPPRFPYNLPYTLLVGAWFLLASGTLYAIVLDQRYRCRVCLRRLRMPIETGSWASMLQFGRPRIEYICLYGHGTLREPELQICGHENPEWTQHSEYWEELCAGAKDEDADR